VKTSSGSPNYGWLTAVALAAMILLPCRARCQTACSAPPCINPAYDGAKTITGLVAGGGTITATITTNGKARNASAAADATGKFTIPVDPPLAAGDTLTFAGTDPKGGTLAAEAVPAAAMVVAQPPEQAATVQVVSLQVLDAPNHVATPAGQFALGETLVVTLNDSRPLKKGSGVFGLFLNGLFMDGINAAPVPNAPNSFQFQLQYTTANRDAWSQLFRCKMVNFGRNCGVVVTVGFKDGSLVAKESAEMLTLKFFPSLWAKFVFGLALALAVVIVLLARRSSLLRDSGAPCTDGKLGTYSLGRTQMALWFVAIVFAFLFIYALTGAITPITQGALALLGIGSGTALGASAIDQNNQTASSTARVQLAAEQATLQSQTQALAQQVAAVQPGDPNLAVLQVQQQATTQRLQLVNAQLAQTGSPQVAASEGLIKDILTDINGLSYHRLQIAAWTLVLAALFLSSLFAKLTMMDFDGTQLTLLGISGGTYLGFKLNEKQS